MEKELDGMGNKKILEKGMSMATRMSDFEKEYHQKKKKDADLVPVSKGLCGGCRQPHGRRGAQKCNVKPKCQPVD